MKNTTKFKVGDRVAVLFDQDRERIVFTSDGRYALPCFGEVVELIDDERVSIRWDEYSPIAFTMFHHSDLQSEKQFKAQQAILEKDFHKLQDTFALKMKEINRLVKEADKEVRSKGLPEEYMLDTIRSLYSTLNICGWNQSSMMC